jgi:hypothetical protein
MPMLLAVGVDRVTNSGIEIATINEAGLTFDVGGRNFSIHRRGILGPEFARSFIAEERDRLLRSSASTTFKATRSGPEHAICVLPTLKESS